MAIKVITKSFNDALADDILLANLIEGQKIIAFRRTSGWVVVGKDPVRENNLIFDGPERRKVIQGVGFFMK